MSTEFKTETFHGQEISYRVDSYGQFSAWINGENVTGGGYGNDLEAIERNAKARARKSKVLVKVPFTHATSGRYGVSERFDPQRATATGVHAGNDDILAVIDTSGEKIRLASYDSRDALVPMSDAELAEGRRLNDEAVASARAFQNWKKEHALDLRSEVATALKKAQGGADND